jgi:hypothetical protein
MSFGGLDLKVLAGVALRELQSFYSFRTTAYGNFP